MKSLQTRDNRLYNSIGIRFIDILIFFFHTKKSTSGVYNYISQVIIPVCEFIYRNDETVIQKCDTHFFSDRAN